MITLLQYSITGLYHEIRNIPKHYKRYTYDEKRVFKDFMFYFTYLFLIIPCLYKLPDLWWCVVLCLIMIIIQLRSLMKQTIIVNDMSKRFKYHVKQRLISVYNKYYGIE